jgi:hypothetical protein
MRESRDFPPGRAPAFNIQTITDIAASPLAETFCALETGGSVLYWGENFGDLPDASSVCVSTPIQISP